MASIVANRHRSERLNLLFMGHSTGGLILRSYLKQNKNSDFLSRNSPRLFLFGTPNQGTPKAYVYIKTGSGFLEGFKGFLATLLLAETRIQQVAVGSKLTYYLLANERYQNYVDFPRQLIPSISKLTYGESLDLTVRQTYFSSESPAALLHERFINYHPIEKKSIVQDALLFHRELGRDTGLDINKTYVFYSSGIQMESQVEFRYPTGPHGRPVNAVVAFVGKKIRAGDGTVIAYSAINLEGVSEEIYDNQGKLINLRPYEKYAFDFKTIGHTDLTGHPLVLEKMWDLINENA